MQLTLKTSTNSLALLFFPSKTLFISIFYLAKKKENTDQLRKENSLYCQKLRIYQLLVNNNVTASYYIL